MINSKRKPSFIIVMSCFLWPHNPTSNSPPWEHIFSRKIAILTFFHHADVDAAFKTTCLAVAPVVFCDGAAPVERTGEGGFALHAASV